MGYRSEVEFYIEGESAAALWLKFVTKHQNNLSCNWFFENEENYVKGDKTGIRFIKESNIIHFYHSNIKWYDSYEDIQALIALWAESAEFDNLCGEFVRLGEELEDVEIDSFGENEYKLQVYRTIESSI